MEETLSDCAQGEGARLAVSTAEGVQGKDQREALPHPHHVCLGRSLLRAHRGTLSLMGWFSRGSGVYTPPDQGGPMDPRLPPLPSCCHGIQKIILKFMSNEASSHAENPLVDSPLCTQSEVIPMPSNNTMPPVCSPHGGACLLEWFDLSSISLPVDCAIQEDTDVASLVLCPILRSWNSDNLQVSTE